MNDWDWVPVVFLLFKVLIFGTCMFFAIKWHYDQGKKKGIEKRVLLRNGAMIAAAFVLALLAVVLLTLGLAKHMGMDLNLP